MNGAQVNKLIKIDFLFSSCLFSYDLLSMHSIMTMNRIWISSHTVQLLHSCQQPVAPIQFFFGFYENRINNIKFSLFFFSSKIFTQPESTKIQFLHLFVIIHLLNWMNLSLIPLQLLRRCWNYVSAFQFFFLVSTAESC